MPETSRASVSPSATQARVGMAFPAFLMIYSWKAQAVIIEDIYSTVNGLLI